MCETLGSNVSTKKGKKNRGGQRKGGGGRRGRGEGGRRKEGEEERNQKIELSLLSLQPLPPCAVK